MRLISLWLTGGLLFSAIGNDPWGCSHSSPPIKAPALIASTQSTAGPFMQPAFDAADPLVPPIVLDRDEAPLPVAHATPSPFFPANFESDPRAHFHPHGNQVCASGCAASNHPTPEMSVETFHQFMQQYALEPMDETSPSLETLLFYGRQTEALIREHGYAPLDRERAKFLRRELKRTHARLQFRLVDAAGVVRVELPPTRVPFDRRHVFEMEEVNLPDLETSGTVKRVGLHHLWTRL